MPDPSSSGRGDVPRGSDQPGEVARPSILANLTSIVTSLSRRYLRYPRGDAEISRRLHTSEQQLKNAYDALKKLEKLYAHADIPSDTPSPIPGGKSLSSLTDTYYQLYAKYLRAEWECGQRSGAANSLASEPEGQALRHQIGVVLTSVKELREEIKKASEFLAGREQPRQGARGNELSDDEDDLMIDPTVGLPNRRQRVQFCESILKEELELQNAYRRTQQINTKADPAV